MSGCDRLVTQDLVLLLSGKTNVANLKKLVLSNTGSLTEGIDLSQALVDALSDKDIAEFDLSSTHVSSNDPILDGICDTLKTVNLSSASVDRKFHMLFNRTCRSLRNLDLSAISCPKNIPNNVSCVDMTLPIPPGFLVGYPFFFSIYLCSI